MVHPKNYFVDSLLLDGDGAVPVWEHIQHGKMDRHGRRRLRMIWPKDKQMNSTPHSSWTRWKDIFTNKGPMIYIGRGGTEPHRPLWSRWMDENDLGLGFDNLGYRDNREELEIWPLDPDLRYDFLTRKYRKIGRGGAPMWSDVKWARGGGPQHALYHRDELGIEYIDGQSGAAHPTRFRYNPDTPYWDWARPE
ncbi:hypothetical protein MMC19_004863 [Ptychographa xylographoides]|nr:hypothetical protein [Ptychographa xylographoides]